MCILYHISMDDRFKSMFAYTDCIPQVGTFICDVVARCICPGAYLFLTDSRAHTDTHRWEWEQAGCCWVSSEHPTRWAVWLLMLCFDGPQRKDGWRYLSVLLTTERHWLIRKQYVWPDEFPGKIGDAWKKWEVVRSKSIGNLVENISFTFLGGILSWFHGVSKFQRLQCYRIWTGKLPSNVTLPHDNSSPSANMYNKL